MKIIYEPGDYVMIEDDYHVGEEKGRG